MRACLQPIGNRLWLVVIYVLWITYDDHLLAPIVGDGTGMRSVCFLPCSL